MKNNSIRNILVVVYDFPPYINGGGVIRTQKFVKYLAQMGYQISTLSAVQPTVGQSTVPEDLYHPAIHRFYALSPDWFRKTGKIIRALTHPLIRKKQREPEISLRSKNEPVNPFSSGIKKIILKFCIPDEHFLWIWISLWKWVFYYQFKIRFDIIMVTVPPVTPIFLAYFISLITRKPLFVDYRDSWVGNELYSHKSKWQNRIEAFFEKTILAHAKGIIVTTPAMKNDLISRYTFSTPVEIITNGFDEEDFKHISSIIPKNELFVLGYFGAIDIKRDPSALFKAISELKQEGFDPENRFRLLFTGFSPFLSLAESFSIGDLVIHHPPVGQRKSIAMMMTCAALLIIITREQGAKTAIPGKTYEYIRTGKPILALADDGALRDFFSDHPSFIFCYPQNTEQIKKAVKQLYHQWLNPKEPSNKVFTFKPFERYQLTLRMIQFFERQLALPENPRSL